MPPNLHASGHKVLSGVNQSGSRAVRSRAPDAPTRFPSFVVSDVVLPDLERSVVVAECVAHRIDDVMRHGIVVQQVPRPAQAHSVGPFTVGRPGSENIPSIIVEHVVVNPVMASAPVDGYR